MSRRGQRGRVMKGDPWRAEGQLEAVAVDATGTSRSTYVNERRRRPFADTPLGFSPRGWGDRSAAGGALGTGK